MRINVKRIPVEGERLRGSEPGAIVEVADADVAFAAPVEYDLLAQLQGRALLVTGKVWTAATLRCSRCLMAFPHPLTVEPFVAHEELHGEDFVDLTPQIREDILLALPQRALCRPECRGLCPACGENLNERKCHCRVAHEPLHWHALDQLKLN
jgi:uncharacterized protein